MAGMLYKGVLLPAGIHQQQLLYARTVLSKILISTACYSNFATALHHGFSLQLLVQATPAQPCHSLHAVVWLQ